MDLALLVYGISLLNGISSLFGLICFITALIITISAIFTASWKFDGNEYSWNLNRDGTVKEKIMAGRKFGEKVFKYSLITFILSSLIVVFIPTEKTAYMMVGAYATQKIAENDKVQETGQKVLTIINQKLDSYVDEGLKAAEKKAKDAVKGSDKKQD